MVALTCLVVLAACGSTGSAGTSTPTGTPLETASPSAAPTTLTPVPITTPSATSTPFPWPAATPTPAADRILFGFLVEGSPASGESFSLYFQAPHMGQNQFELCGGLIQCAPGPEHVYLFQTPANTPAGPSPWALQRLRPGQPVATVASGTVDVSQGGTVTATTTT